MQLVLSASYPPPKSPPPARSREPQQAASLHSQSGRGGGAVSKNNSMLSPKLLLCLLLCHELPRHISLQRKIPLSHATQMKPQRQSFRGIESFPVCPMSRPPTSFQLSRLCQSNPPASQGSREVVS